MSSCHILTWSETTTSVAANPDPELSLFWKLVRAVHKHLSSAVTLLMIRLEIQPRDNFYFPEFLRSPIRCAVAARRDDLGLFIAARLNIYFSAQGEAEKKNVSLQGSVSGGFSTITPLHPLLLHHWRLQGKKAAMAPKGIMGYILGLGRVSERPRACKYFWKIARGSTRCFGFDCYIASGRRLHFSSQHIVLIRFLSLMTHNPLL